MPVTPGAVTVPVHIVPDLPAAPSTTPAWLIRLVAFLLPLVGVGLDVWNPSHRIDSSAAQAAVVVAFLIVAAIIFVVHVALAAVHEYGWSKSAAGVFLAESGDELKALIGEAKPLVEQAKPALDAIGPLSDLASRVGEVEHTVAEKVGTVPTVDRAVIEATVREVLAGVAASVAPSPAVEAAPAPETSLEAPAGAGGAVAPVSGAPVTTALPGSAPAAN